MLEYSKFIQLLCEKPILSDEEIVLKDSLYFMSKEELDLEYVPFIKLSKSIWLYEAKDRYDFLAGGFSDIDGVDTLYVVTFIVAEKIDIGLSNISIQIKMVETNKSLANLGMTSLIYAELAKKYSLISDCKHFKFSKILWQSLAKYSFINMFMYNVKTKVFTKYDGKNVDETKIWGKNEKYKEILLVIK